MLTVLTTSFVGIDSFDISSRKDLSAVSYPLSPEMLSFRNLLISLKRVLLILWRFLCLGFCSSFHRHRNFITMKH